MIRRRRRQTVSFLVEGSDPAIKKRVAPPFALRAGDLVVATAYDHDARHTTITVRKGSTPEERERQAAALRKLFERRIGG